MRSQALSILSQISTKEVLLYPISPCVHTLVKLVGSPNQVSRTMTSRDHLGDSNSTSSEDEDRGQDDLTWWGAPGVSEDSEPPAIVLDEHREAPQQRNGLGSQRGQFYRTSQRDAPLVANMATADNRHSTMVPEVPERTTNKRYRLA